MKLYLAGNYNIMNVLGREREVCQMMPVWKRLFSFYFLHLIHKSEILKLKHEDNGNYTRSRIIRG